MLNARVPAAGEAMPAASVSPTIASAIAAHSAAQSANGEAHNAHEMRPDDITEAVAAALFAAANACHDAERAAWFTFLDVPCLTPIDVQAKLAHAFGADGSFDEDRENARLLRSLVLPVFEPASILSTSVNAGALAALSMSELSSLHDGTITLANVIAAFCCQPRFLDKDGFLNAAGAPFDNLDTLLCGLQDFVLQEALSRDPASDYDREIRAWIIQLDDATSRDGVEVGR